MNVKESLSSPAILLYCTTLPKADRDKVLIEFGLSTSDSMMTACPSDMEISALSNNTAIKPSLAAAFRSARKFAGLTQEGLAAKAGLAVKSIRLLEREGEDHRASTVSQACQALQIPEILLRYVASSPSDRESVVNYFTQREE